jgi:NADPH-dependent 2,4-dienoyl-CoA reductase/sulfur reductase-like enzyme
VVIGDGTSISYDRLLLATGAEPRRLTIPGAELPHVHVLRTLADSRGVIEAAITARSAAVIGAGFIGLEVAASLRSRNVDVHVIAPDTVPMERILGRQMGIFLRALHEEHGVVFHLDDAPAQISPNSVTTKRGSVIEADLVIVGIGVRPRTALAEQAGLKVQDGVVVDAGLETSVEGIFAAGDVARWPDRHSGDSIRVEHWVVAERMGQTAALNMLGHHKRFDAVPFFWSQHYDVPINYVGHAEGWDEIEIEGDIARKDCLLRFKRGGRLLAVATIFRDADSLLAERAMESSQVAATP